MQTYFGELKKMTQYIAYSRINYLLQDIKIALKASILTRQQTTLNTE